MPVDYQVLNGLINPVLLNAQMKLIKKPLQVVAILLNLLQMHGTLDLLSMLILIRILEKIRVMQALISRCIKDSNNLLILNQLQ